MKELSYDVLNIELTRRCNLACRHCLRGDAQNVDLSKESIDALLENTRQINYLSFTGGEPSLCIDAMRYFLDRVKAMNVFLGDFSIIINGKIQSQELVDVLKDYSRYIGQWQQSFDPRFYMHVGISQDQYHYGYDSMDAYYFYKVRLFGFSEVKLARNGICPTKLGRAMNLPESIEGIDKFIGHQRIEILSADSELVCPDAANYKLYYPEQIFIPCEIYITANGDIVNKKFADVYGDYARIDQNTICNVKDDIYEEILKYNEGLPSCRLCTFKELNLIKRNLPLSSLKLLLFASDKKKASMNLKHAELQVIPKIFGKLSDKDKEITFEGESELIDQLQKEFDEKEDLFERMIAGETDINTTYINDKTYIEKHMMLMEKGEIKRNEQV